MKTWHVHIAGQVQGVGFRPYVYKTAIHFSIKGYVNNTTDGVHIYFNADKILAEAFYTKLINEPPAISIIQSASITDTDYQSFSDFQIIHSESTSNTQLLLTPDIATCASCKEELNKSSDRRFNYPFITCTDCGPRYSIAKGLPYDRENTTMNRYSMCPECDGEYMDPNTRRYYSQTNSCETCGVRMTLYNAKKEILSDDTESIVHKIADLWSAGNIIAIKGIGGYVLSCDATNDTAVDTLRERKQRPSKPFAVMYPRISDLKEYNLTRQMAKELLSTAAPIVLIPSSDRNTLSASVAPGLDQIGVAIPYTPLYQILLDSFNTPIVFTSGNVSSEPIVYTDAMALESLSGIADYILVNDREIVVPQDDSVVRYSPFMHQRIVLRRSRGLAPTFITDNNTPDLCIVAVGATMKNTVTVYHNNNTYISQYIGDLSSYTTQLNQQAVLRHMIELLSCTPELLLSDTLTESISPELISDLNNKEHITIQHHKAHFASVLGEHGLISYDEPILGVVWDGTGIGEDGNIWGGEFFSYENHEIKRVAQLEYFDFILGDKMPREPRLSALSLCAGIKNSDELLENKFSQQEWSLYTKLLNKESALQSSSIGRLFDGVASLLDLSDKQSYEAEAALKLEYLANKYCQKNGLTISESYIETLDDHSSIPTRVIISRIIEDLKNGTHKEYIAAKFHFTLVEIIKQIAIHLNINCIALSGGVFQNALLVDMIYNYMGESFDLRSNVQLSPNDENISYGQLIYYQIEQERIQLITKINDHVLSHTR